MIYDNLIDDSLRIKDIHDIENIKENLTWCEEGSLKIPYLNNIRIKAIRFTNKNIDILSTFES